MNGKFSAIPREMLDDGRITALDIAVYAALDSFADSDGAACPSIPAIAGRAKASLSTVKRALSRLELAGYVIRQRRRMPDSREHDTTLYRIVFRGNGAGANDCFATPDIGSNSAEGGSGTAGRPALVVSNISAEGTEVSSEGGDISALQIQEAGSDGEYSPALISSDVGTDRTEAGSEEGNTPAPAVQDVSSEGARKHTHGSGANEREHDDTLCLPACVRPAMPSTDKPGETPKGAMTREEWVERLFDELWELYPQKIYREDAKETFSAIFPEGLSRETAERRLRAITERFAVLGENAKRLIQRGDKRYIPSLRNWLVKEGFGDV